MCMGVSVWETQVEQALDLLGEWEKLSTIDMNDALQLLSAHFTHPKVRMAAARRVAIADDHTLVAYLLQLVQALRYEAVGKDGDSLLNLLGILPPDPSACPTPLHLPYGVRAPVCVSCLHVCARFL